MDLEIKILVKPTGEQEVTIGGKPFALVDLSDKIKAIREAAKAQCGIADFIHQASIDIIAAPCVGNA